MTDHPKVMHLVRMTNDRAWRITACGHQIDRGKRHLNTTTLRQFTTCTKCKQTVYFRSQVR